MFVTNAERQRAIKRIVLFHLATMELNNSGDLCGFVVLINQCKIKGCSLETRPETLKRTNLFSALLSFYLQTKGNKEASEIWGLDPISRAIARLRADGSHERLWSQASIRFLRRLDAADFESFGGM